MKAELVLSDAHSHREALLEQFNSGSRAWLGFKAIADRSHQMDGAAVWNTQAAMDGINHVLDIALDFGLVNDNIVLGSE